MRNTRGSIGGVTVGNGWMYNNPCLRYPEGHESMSEQELEMALREDDRHNELNPEPEQF